MFDVCSSDLEDEEDDDMEEENAFPTDIKGKLFAISGKFNISKSKIVAAIEKNGGIVSKVLTVKVDVFITNPEASAYQIAKKKGIFIAGPEYLTNFY